MRFKFFMILLLVGCNFANAQSNRLTTDRVRYYDYTYLPNIRTVILNRPELVRTANFLFLDSTDQVLRLRFDDMNGGFEQYRYTIIHCDADWRPSNLYVTEYIEGLETDMINESAQSIGTYNRYTHYQLDFPNMNMKPSISGNYILLVYRNDDINDLVLTRRFMVFDKQTHVAATVKQGTFGEDRFEKQEVDFVVNFTELQPQNVWDQVKVVVRQNNRWDNAIRDLEPTFASVSQLTYDYQRENLFKGGNEYRMFDTRSVMAAGRNINIQDVQYDSTQKQYHFFLYEDVPRADRARLNWIDLNGDRIIRTRDGDNRGNEGEYVYVNFRLKRPEVTDGDIYIFGQLSDWQAQERFRMTYSKKRRQYEATVFLKQGVYNYEYVFVKDGEIDNSFIEGQYSETENDYEVFVYYRPITWTTDLLVGYAKLNTHAR